jgi:hypothetical protein
MAGKQKRCELRDLKNPEWGVIKGVMLSLSGDRETTHEAFKSKKTPTPEVLIGD